MGRESPPQSPQSPPQPELSPLLQKIGKHTRDEQKDDARFERIARGEATAEEIANLKSGKDASGTAASARDASAREAARDASAKDAAKDASGKDASGKDASGKDASGSGRDASGRDASGEDAPVMDASARDGSERDASDVDVAIRVEASRPLGDAAIDRIVARVIPSALPAGATPASNNVDANVNANVNAAGAKVLRPTFGRRLITIGGPIAIAAALVLFISSQRGPRVPDGPELPFYSISASGDQQMRGGSEPVTAGGGAVGGGGGAGGAGVATTRLHLGKGRESRFEIVLRPATAPIGKVVAYGFAVGDGAAVPEPLEAKVEIAPEGAIRISGAARALEGVRSIRVVVGAPEAIGKFDDAIARAKGTSEGDAHVRVLTIAIDR